MISSKLLGLSAIGILALGAGLWLGQTYLRPTPAKPTIAGIYLEPPIELEPFTLTQASGEPLTLGDFKGRWNVLFFGFTHCPDVCPTTLQKLAVMDRRLAEQGQDDGIAYWFISVDPRRDTPQRLTEYLAAFSPALRGATGPEVELAKLTSKLGVYFKAEPPDDEHAEHAAHENYMVQHSGAVMVLNPAAEYQAVFTHPDSDTPAVLAADLVELRDYYGRAGAG